MRNYAGLCDCRTDASCAGRERDAKPQDEQRDRKFARVLEEFRSSEERYNKGT